jgi:hypothetical protein
MKSPGREPREPEINAGSWHLLEDDIWASSVANELSAISLGLSQRPAIYVAAHISEGPEDAFRER